MRHLTPAFILCIGLIFLSGPAFSVDCLDTGETYDSLILTPVTKRILKLKARNRSFPLIDLPAVSLNENGSQYGFSKANISNQNIQLRALAINSGPLGFQGRKVEAFAQGRLLLDFAVDCDNIAGETVTTTISYRTKRVGRIISFRPGSTASVRVLSKVIDTVTNSNVDFRIVEDTSVGNRFGSYKVIAKVPIPIPAGQNVSDDLQESVIESVVLQLVKGRTYRFEFKADNRAIAGFGTIIPPLTPFSSVNFETDFSSDEPDIGAFGFGWEAPVDLLGFGDDPGIELSDFKIIVSADQSDEIANLKVIAQSLQNSISLLSAKFENLDPNLGEKITELEENNALLDDNIAALQDEQSQLGTEVSSIQGQLSDFNDQLANLQQANALQDSNIAALQDEQTQLGSEISSFQQQLLNINDLLVGLQMQIEELRNYTQNHTHEYLTGKGSGHNNANAITSPPSGDQQ